MDDGDATMPRRRRKPRHIGDHATAEAKLNEALKLLGILEGKSLGSILAEAVRFYLRHKGAYDLDVTSKKS